MGRAGIEPATLGLKVRLDQLQRAAGDGNVLQMTRFVAATNCSQMHPAETSLYAHLYAHLPSLLTTDQLQASSNSPCRPAVTDSHEGRHGSRLEALLGEVVADGGR
jgi:hypothetical protein